LSRYDGDTWQTLDTRTGLIANDVYSIAIAPDGDVWAGTRGGVSRIGVKR
jgi:ligand-binding sensor domain-containing protein